MKIYGFVKLLQHPINTKFFRNTAWKVSKYGDFSGPYFSVFRLNTEIYSVNLRIQSEYRKISVFSPNTGKYGSEKTPYLDIFLAV